MTQVFIGEINIGVIEYEEEPFGFNWWVDCPRHAVVKKGNYLTEEEAKNFFRMSLPPEMRHAVKFV